MALEVTESHVILRFSFACLLLVGKARAVSQGYVDLPKHNLFSLTILSCDL